MRERERTHIRVTRTEGERSSKPNDGQVRKGFVQRVQELKYVHVVDTHVTATSSTKEVGIEL